MIIKRCRHESGVPTGRHDERSNVLLRAVTQCNSFIFIFSWHQQAAVGAVLLICDSNLRKTLKLLLISPIAHIFNSSLSVPFS